VILEKNIRESNATPGESLYSLLPANKLWTMKNVHVQIY